MGFGRGLREISGNAKEARVAEQADARDLKPRGEVPPCGFESHPGHTINRYSDRTASNRFSLRVRRVSHSVGILLGMLQIRLPSESEFPAMCFTIPLAR